MERASTEPYKLCLAAMDVERYAILRKAVIAVRFRREGGRYILREELYRGIEWEGNPHDTHGRRLTSDLDDPQTPNYYGNCSISAGEEKSFDSAERFNRRLYYKSARDPDTTIAGVQWSSKVLIFWSMGLK